MVEGTFQVLRYFPVGYYSLFLFSSREVDENHGYFRGGKFHMKTRKKKTKQKP